MPLYSLKNCLKSLKNLGFSASAQGCVACDLFHIQNECFEPDAQQPWLACETGSDLLAAPFEPLKRENDLEVSQPKTINVMAFALAIILAIGISPTVANDWGKDGDFKLAVKTEPNSIWNFSKSEWEKQHFFEKSVRGYEFKLAKLPSRYEGKTRRDQLLSLIASVEAPCSASNIDHRADIAVDRR